MAKKDFAKIISCDSGDVLVEHHQRPFGDKRYGIRLSMVNDTLARVYCDYFFAEEKAAIAHYKSLGKEEAELFIKVVEGDLTIIE